MSLPDSYLFSYGRVPDYFEALKNARPPDRFTHEVLKNLGFSSSNDRQLIGVLKELGFLDGDSMPQQRYYEFLDRSKSEQVMADAIKDAYGDLFAININAEQMDSDDVENKLRTLYAGQKSDNLIKLIAKTFTALVDIADFSRQSSKIKDEQATIPSEEVSESDTVNRASAPKSAKFTASDINSLQYHINIVLPATRDQAIYDAIFKSLREHLG